MKKVFLSLAIVAALTVVSCKQAEAAPADATATVDSTAAAATATVDSTAAAATTKVDAAAEKAEDAKAPMAAPVKK